MPGNQDDVLEKPDILDHEDVKRLVDSFYLRVRADQELGEIFDGVMKVDWEDHLPKMYLFWQMVLFQSPVYKGNPRAVHMKVRDYLQGAGRKGITLHDFERWLTHFFAAVDDLFAGPMAEQAKHSASRIANSLSVVVSATG